MANLTESQTYDEGVYQLETTDPVIGGPDGTSNKPLRALANRTNWLKATVDAMPDQANGIVDAAVTAHEQHANPHPQYLTEADAYNLAGVASIPSGIFYRPAVVALCSALVEA